MRTDTERQADHDAQTRNLLGEEDADLCVTCFESPCICDAQTQAVTA